MVNRDFYNVFTSDQLWASFDVYEKRQNIFSDFIERLPGFEHILTRFQKNPKYRVVGSRRHRFFIPENLGNDYVSLVLLSRNWWKKRYYTDYSTTSQFNIYSRMCAGPSAVEDKLLPRLMSTSRHHYINHSLSKAEIPSHPEVVLDTKAKYPQELELWNPEFDFSRDEILAATKKFPLFLCLFPEYWNYREFCLAALNFDHAEVLQPWVGPFKDLQAFLRGLMDKELIDKATELYPSSIAVFPDRFRDKKDVLVNHLSLVDYESFDVWFKGVKNDNNAEFLCDAQIIATIMDRNFLTEESWSEFPAPELLSVLCDDYTLIMDRILKNPRSWLRASDRLKHDKTLLMCALDGYPPAELYIADHDPHEWIDEYKSIRPKYERKKSVRIGYTFSYDSIYDEEFKRWYKAISEHHNPDPETTDSESEHQPTPAYYDPDPEIVDSESENSEFDSDAWPSDSETEELEAPTNFASLGGLPTILKSERAKELHHDVEVLNKIVSVGGLGTIPVGLWTLDMLELHYIVSPTFFLAEPDKYEISRSLVLRDLKYIINTKSFLHDFLEDPLILTHLQEHWNEVLWYLYTRETLNKRVCCAYCGPRFYDGPLKLADEYERIDLTRETRMRLAIRFPIFFFFDWYRHHSMFAPRSRLELYDIDLVVDAVTANKHVYQFLPGEYLLNSRVLDAMNSNPSQITPEDVHGLQLE